MREGSVDAEAWRDGFEAVQEEEDRALEQEISLGAARG